MFIVQPRGACAALPSVRLAVVYLATAVFLTPILAPEATVAGQGDVGIVDAVGGPPIPAGAPVAVVAAEFTDLNTRLQEVVERALAARGFTLDPDAPMILSFDTEMSNQTADVPDRAGGNVVGSGEPGADESPHAEQPWQDAGGELGREQPEIGEPQVTIPFGGAGGDGGGSRYSLSFTLGRDGRPPLWQGSVTVQLQQRDPFEAAQAMVPVLVDAIGRTVRGEPVSIH